MQQFWHSIRAKSNSPRAKVEWISSNLSNPQYELVSA
jgi:hypothetical protein